MGDTSGGRPASPDERHLYGDDGNGTSPLTCCCGNPDCDNLRRNNAALADLERDIQIAAQLGQALLKRHESYVAESEKGRRAMLLRIEQLEQEKKVMERDNGTMIEDNRELLKQLELLNKTIVDSDAEIKGMAVALQTTKNDMQSLAHSAMRVAELEDQISQMELDQVELNERLELAREDESAAINRWKKAEYMLQHLENELVQLEKESREERERHNKVIERMERRRAVERELETAAARLKGAAAATSSLGLTVHTSLGEPDVVTTFVRDILADNATLQAGIVELREMLDNSNDEVQLLRERLVMDRPMSSMSSGRPQAATSLRDELNASLSATQPQSELHVHHHHYHTPLACNTTVYMPPHGRHRRRRTVMGPSNTEAGGQSRCKHRAYGSLSSISTLLSQTAATIPPPPPAQRHSRRWASQSSASGYTMASLASSPRSRETASIFSRVDRGFESSRPTSPESTGIISPPWVIHSRNVSETTLRSSCKHGEVCGLASPIDLQEFDFKNVGGHYYDGAAMPEKSNTNVTIPEEGEDHDEQPIAPAHSSPISYQEDSIQKPIETSLKRASSHDNLHARQEPKSTQPHVCFKVPKRLFSAGVAPAPPPAPVVSETNIAADTTLLALSSRKDRDPQYLLHKVAAAVEALEDEHNDRFSRNSAASPSLPETPSPSPAQSATPSTLSSDTNKVSIRQRFGIGGWVLGKWGMMPTRSSELRSEAHYECIPRRPHSVPPSSSKKKDNNTLFAFWSRSTGVNQKGPIPGLGPPPKAPVSLEPPVDHELLRETLQE
ncbi:hypothetical protein KEM54_004876 [Ascosphaera aggregata]|nr:hypothetical protein KEM54_004876 [Ascosphaera aggregata]